MRCPPRPVTQEERLAVRFERRFVLLIFWIFLGLSGFILSIIGFDKKDRDPYLWIVFIHLAIAVGLGYWVSQAFRRLREEEQKRGGP